MGDPGTTSGFYAARPTFQVGGQDKPDLSESLSALLVEETTAGLYRCEATFGNWGAARGQVDYLHLDRSLFDFGAPFSVSAGDGEAAAELFNGRITGLEARYPQAKPPEILVLAEDRFQDLRMTRRTRTYEEVTDADVFRQLASEHSLQADVDVDGPTYGVLAQVNQSDLAFLRERARCIDAEVWMEAGTLHAQARSRRNEGVLTLTYGRGLRELSVLADVATQRTSFTVSGWDVSAKEEVAYEATASAIGSELNGYESGPSLLQNAFGARPESIVHMTPFNLDEARHFAEAQFRKMARGFVKGRGVAQGDGQIRVGARVNLPGIGGLFTGEYYVCEVRHVFTADQGFFTYFCIERPGVSTTV